MKLMKSRVIRAKVVGLRPATCLFASRERFLEQLKDEDMRKYLQLSNSYTDFDKEGKDQLQEV